MIDFVLTCMAWLFGFWVICFVGYIGFAVVLTVIGGLISGIVSIFKSFGTHPKAERE